MTNEEILNRINDILDQAIELENATNKLDRDISGLRTELEEISSELEDQIKEEKEKK